MNIGSSIRFRGVAICMITGRLWAMYVNLTDEGQVQTTLTDKNKLH